MSDKYRLSWESVGVSELHKYMNADPRFYSNCTQTVPNSEIPDMYWHKVGPKEISGGDDNDQYKTLKEWAEQDREFIRNVLLERCVSQPTWEVVLPL